MKRRSGQSRYRGWMSCIFWESKRLSEFKAFPALFRLSPGPGRHPLLSMPGKNGQIRPRIQGARAAECPHGHCLLAHPSKTKLSFSERNIRGHSICLHSWPTNKGLILAIISPTPTPTPHRSHQYTQASPLVSCQVSQEAHWVSYWGIPMAGLNNDHVTRIPGHSLNV